MMLSYHIKFEMFGPPTRKPLDLIIKFCQVKCWVILKDFIKKQQY